MRYTAQFRRVGWLPPLKEKRKRPRRKFQKTQNQTGRKIQNGTRPRGGNRRRYARGHRRCSGRCRRSGGGGRRRRRRCRCSARCRSTKYSWRRSVVEFEHEAFEKKGVKWKQTQERRFAYPLLLAAAAAAFVDAATMTKCIGDQTRFKNTSSPEAAIAAEKKQMMKKRKQKI